MWSTGHTQLWAVVGGNTATAWQERRHLLFSGAHAEHASTGKVLHHAAALGHQLHGILQGEHAGQAGRSELADAVPHHRVGNDAPVHPQLG